MVTALIVVMVLLVYTWILYPGIMLLLSRKRNREQSLPELGHDAPLIAFVFSAHNEEKVIGARLANLTNLDYPNSRLSIYVGIDGCTDRTESIARDWASIDSRIHVTSQFPCQGKTSMLKRLVGMIRGEAPDVDFLVFTDANTTFERDALRRLVAPFSDPGVGGVCGRLVLGKAIAPCGVPVVTAVSAVQSPGRKDAADTAATTEESEAHFPLPTPEPSYWNLETRLKKAESRLDSCLGANGAIYAIRSELFPVTMPENVIIDDFVIGMKVREQGFRMIFEPLAVAREDLPESVRDEWRRRVRIGAGAYQALSLCRACLSPGYGRFAWFFWSHKVLRWFTPHCLIVLLGIMGWGLAGWVASTEGYVVNLAAVAVAFSVLCGVLFYDVWVRFQKSVDLALYFITMQAALLVGFLKFCRGNLSGKWERTER